MNLSDEIRNLQELHDAGALTNEEFARAKDAVLTSATTPSRQDDPASLDRHLQQIQIQNEIKQVDREWEIEREKYISIGQYGARNPPNELISIIAAIVLGGFGLYVIIDAISKGAPILSPILGIAFILFGACVGVGGCLNARMYQKAYQRYRRRRTELLAQEDRGEC